VRFSWGFRVWVGCVAGVTYEEGDGGETWEKEYMGT
jgi:hypothetical protein